MSGRRAGAGAGVAVAVVDRCGRLRRLQATPRDALGECTRLDGGSAAEEGQEEHGSGLHRVEGCGGSHPRLRRAGAVGSGLLASGSGADGANEWGSES